MDGLFGTPNKRTLDVIERLDQLGCDPIEGMAKIALDPQNPVELRARMFSDLRSTLHPSGARSITRRQTGPATSRFLGCLRKRPSHIAPQCRFRLPVTGPICALQLVHSRPRSKRTGGCTRLTELRRIALMSESGLGGHVLAEPTGPLPGRMQSIRTVTHGCINAATLKNLYRLIPDAQHFNACAGAVSLAASHYALPWSGTLSALGYELDVIRAKKNRHASGFGRRTG